MQGGGCSWCLTPPQSSSPSIPVPLQSRVLELPFQKPTQPINPIVWQQPSGRHHQACRVQLGLSCGAALPWACCWGSGLPSYLERHRLYHESLGMRCLPQEKSLCDTTLAAVAGSNYHSRYINTCLLHKHSPLHVACRSVPAVPSTTGVMLTHVENC